MASRSSWVPGLLKMWTPEVPEGSVYAVPLFLTEAPSTKSFARVTFADRGDEFAFVRIITDLEGGGFLAEVFALVGNLRTDLHGIVAAPRLFPPIAVSGLGILKKRWKLIGTQPGYDRETHSSFPAIELVIGDPARPRLWRDGTETPITVSESREREAWVVWLPSRLEQRILAALTAQGLFAAP